MLSTVPENRIDLPHLGVFRLRAPIDPTTDRAHTGRYTRGRTPDQVLGKGKV
ncbi:MAG: hypothetical protein M3003_06790 [Candidatus Dormibacteraeota bacterium]|nr:hypothetical protein [Candidatus Dormibacteraeota bacterium]